MAQPPPADVPVAAVPSVPGAPHAGVTAPAPRTYKELYLDTANNPPHDRTTGYLAGYRFTDPAGVGVEFLHQLPCGIRPLR